jgi:hypothetical protein
MIFVEVISERISVLTLKIGSMPFAGTNNRTAGYNFTIQHAINVPIHLFDWIIPRCHCPPSFLRRSPTGLDSEADRSTGEARRARDDGVNPSSLSNFWCAWM